MPIWSTRLNVILVLPYEKQWIKHRSLLSIQQGPMLYPLLFLHAGILITGCVRLILCERICIQLVLTDVWINESFSNVLIGKKIIFEEKG